VAFGSEGAPGAKPGWARLSNGPSQSEFRAVSESSGAANFPIIPGIPAVPASNVDKTCGQTERPFDEASFCTLLTVGEVAKLLRCSKATVYGLIDRKKLTAVRVSNAIRVRREEVEALLRPV
jgi:excisionase family DNA binding protein